MNISKIWFENDRIYGLSDNGKIAWQSLLWYQQLRKATDQQRENYEIDEEGIHWYDLDEDISFESFDYEDREPQGVAKVFLSHPELNVSAVARRLSISQSLMAQYISGHKKPSKERETLIFKELGKIGRELIEISEKSMGYSYKSRPLSGYLSDSNGEQPASGTLSTKDCVSGYGSK